MVTSEFVANASLLSISSGRIRWHKSAGVKRRQPHHRPCTKVWRMNNNPWILPSTKNRLPGTIPTTQSAPLNAFLGYPSFLDELGANGSRFSNCFFLLRGADHAVDNATGRPLPPVFISAAKMSSIDGFACFGVHQLGLLSQAGPSQNNGRR